MKTLLTIAMILQSALALAGQSELIQLDTDFKDEQRINKTIYVPQEERSQYEIKINDKGLILDSEGNVLDTRNLANGTAMFVYSKEGKIYLSTVRKPLIFDHSSLVGGEDVIVAGSMNVNRGRIDYITDASAMYESTSHGNLKSVIHRLNVMGADTQKMRAFFQNNF